MKGSEVMLKRGIKFLLLLIAVALVVGCVLYAVKSAVDLGDSIIKNTEQKYEYSNPNQMRYLNLKLQNY